MSYKLTLSVFRFDAKTDYLPYYKKFVINVNEDATVSDVLEKIKDEEKDFGYSTDSNASVVLNGVYLFTKTKIKKVVTDLGKELSVEPISKKRVLKDMIIDENDFYSKFDILDAFVEGADKRKYKKLIREFYASKILLFNDEYIGDALLSFAYDMIEKYPQSQKKILSAIADEQNGIWQHIDITNALYPFDDSLQEKVDALKNKILKQLPTINCIVKQQNKLISSN
jgi:DNA-directed RNA polymerase beta' subunit